MGDVLILAGAGDALRQAVADCGLLALSSRRPRRRRSSAGPGLAIFGLGILGSALGIAPPELAFGAVIIALALNRSLDLRTAVRDLNWPNLFLLGLFIPTSRAD